MARWRLFGDNFPALSRRIPVLISALSPPQPSARQVSSFDRKEKGGLRSEE